MHAFSEILNYYWVPLSHKIPIVCMLWLTCKSICPTAAINEFSALNSGNCPCIGDILIFSCTAVGGGGTRWGGTAFNCPSLLNEIILRHSLYDSPSGTSGHCNGGAITARSIDVSESADVSCYTSQLSVTIQNISSTVTIQCTHNSLSGPIPIGESAVTAVSGN